MIITNETSAPLLSSNAQYILRKRYLERDLHGRLSESPAEMLRRVARVVAQAELIYNPKADIVYWENAFFDIMARLELLPNSPTLLNAGRLSGQLSSCFVCCGWGKRLRRTDAVPIRVLQPGLNQLGPHAHHPRYD